MDGLGFSCPSPPLYEKESRSETFTDTDTAALRAPAGGLSIKQKSLSEQQETPVNPESMTVE